MLYDAGSKSRDFSSYHSSFKEELLAKIQVSLYTLKSIRLFLDPLTEKFESRAKFEVKEYISQPFVKVSYEKMRIKCLKGQTSVVNWIFDRIGVIHRFEGLSARPGQVLATTYRIN